MGGHHTSTTEAPTRREYVKYGGAVVGGSLLAGCAGQSDSGSTPTETQTGSATATDNQTETATPEDTSYSVTISPMGTVGFDEVPGRVVAYDGYRTAGRSSAWAGRFLAGLSGIVVAAFATVFALWGTPSLVGAVRATVGTAGPYLLAHGPSVWISTATWTLATVRIHLRLPAVLAFALWGGWWVGREAGCASTWGPPHLALGLAAALGLPLLVRPFVTYWVYPLPVLSVLAAVGIRAALFEGTGGW